MRNNPNDNSDVFISLVIFGCIFATLALPIIGAPQNALSLHIQIP